MNRLKLIFVLMLLLSVYQTHSQNIFINQTNGTTVSFSISELKKMTFSDGSLQVYDDSGSTDNFALNNLRNITFYDINTDIPFFVNDINCRIFPNPVGDFLTIDLSDTNIKSTIEIQIIDMNGRLIKAIKTQNPKTTISLKAIAKGNYLIKISYANKHKVEKIIKY